MDICQAPVVEMSISYFQKNIHIARLILCIIFVYVFIIICNRHLQREAEVLNE